MNFLQNILRIEPILRRKGMCIQGDESYIAIEAGETLVTLTRTNEGHYIATSMRPYEKPQTLGTLSNTNPKTLLKTILSAF